MPKDVVIRIIGDASEFKKSIGEVKSALSGVGKSVSPSINQTVKSINSGTNSSKKFSTALKQLDGQVNKSAQGFRILAASAENGFARAPLTGKINQTTGAIKQYTAAQANANTVLLSFSQGVQDLPFGLIAIQNNITSLVAQFGFLQQKAGGLKGSLSLIGKSLMGPGGVLFAISAVTSIITVLSMRSRTTKTEIDSLGDSLKSLADRIKTVADVQGDSISNSAKETAELQSLYTAATDVTRSMDERKSAADKLISTYPDTLKGLSDMDIISGRAAGSFKTLSENIEKTAHANAILQEMTENFRAIGDAQKIIDKQTSSEEFVKQTEKYSSALNEAKKVASQTAIGLGSVSSLAASFGKSSELNKATKAWEKYLSPIKKAQKIINDAKEANDNLLKEFNALDFSKAGEDAGKKLKDGIDKSFDPQKRFEQFIIDLRHLSEEAQTFHWVDGELQEKQINLVTTAITEFIKNEALATSQAEKLRGIYEDLAKKLPIKPIDQTPVTVPLNIGKTYSDEFKKSLSTLNTSLDTAKFQEEVLGIPSDQTLKARLSAYKKFLEDMNAQGISPNGPQQMLGVNGNLQLTESGVMARGLEAYKELNEEASKFKTNQNETFSLMKKNAEIIANSFSGLLEAFVNGTKLGDVFIQTIKRLIIQLAEAAIKAAIFKAIMAGATGGASGGIGILGSLFGGVAHYASGGFIPSPQLAVVGDAPGGEWVLNQNQMSALLNGANKNIRISGEFVQRGNDLVAVVDTQRGMNNIF